MDNYLKIISMKSNLPFTSNVVDNEYAWDQL